MTFFSTKNFFKPFLLLSLLSIFLGLILSFTCSEAYTGQVEANRGQLVTFQSIVKESTACCDGYILQTWDSFKNMFIVDNHEINKVITLFILSTVFIFIIFNLGFSQTTFSPKDLKFYKLYKKNKPNLIFGNHLQFIFALNTPNLKIF